MNYTRGDSTMRYLRKLRIWALNRLDGIDRSTAKQFAADYLQPNGRAAITVTDDYAQIRDRTISATTPGAATIAVAPWARYVVITGNLFLESDAKQDALPLESDAKQAPIGCEMG